MVVYHSGGGWEVQNEECASLHKIIIDREFQEEQVELRFYSFRNFNTIVNSVWFCSEIFDNFPKLWKSNAGSEQEELEH